MSRSPLSLLPPVTSWSPKHARAHHSKSITMLLKQIKRALALISNMVSRLAVEEDYYETSPLYYNHGIIVVMPSVIWIQNIPRDLGDRCLSESELEVGSNSSLPFLPRDTGGDKKRRRDSAKVFASILLSFFFTFNFAPKMFLAPVGS